MERTLTAGAEDSRGRRVEGHLVRCHRHAIRGRATANPFDVIKALASAPAQPARPIRAGASYSPILPRGRDVMRGQKLSRPELEACRERRDANRGIGNPSAIRRRSTSRERRKPRGTGSIVAEVLGIVLGPRRGDVSQWNMARRSVSLALEHSTARGGRRRGGPATRPEAIAACCAPQADRESVIASRGRRRSRRSAGHRRTQAHPEDSA